MSLVQTLLKVFATSFDTQRRLLSDHTTCVFLAPDGGSVNYRETHTAGKGWLLTYSKFRQAPLLLYAATDPAFQQALDNSTHIAVGTAVYEIQQGDTALPDGAEPYYRLLLARTEEVYEL